MSMALRKPLCWAAFALLSGWLGVHSGEVDGALLAIGTRLGLDRPMRDLRINSALGLSAIAAFASVGGPTLAADGARDLAHDLAHVAKFVIKKSSITSRHI